MAKRRKRTVRRARTRSKSSFRRKKSSGNPLVKTAMGAVAYGFGRQYVSNQVAQLTNKIGLPGIAGEMSDEIGMLALSWALAKGKIPLLNKVSFMRDAGKAGVAIESAIIGRQLAGRVNLGGMSTTGSSSGSQTVFI